MTADQSQAERILALIAKARPGWSVRWYEGGGGYFVIHQPAVEWGEGIGGFVEQWDGRPQTRAHALLRAVERAAAKGWK